MACYICQVYGLSTNTRSIASDILHKAAIGYMMISTQRSELSLGYDKGVWKANEAFKPPLISPSTPPPLPIIGPFTCKKNTAY